MSVSDEMIERARDLCGYGCGCDQDATDGCPNWEGGRCTFQAQMIAKALEAARAEGMMIARRLVQRKIGALDCDNAIYDSSCGIWECSSEIRGYDCLCADRIEQAEAIVAAIDARLSEMDRQPVNEGRGE